MSDFGRFFTETGYGGIVVLVVLFTCLTFYGSLIAWIVRGEEE